MPPDDPPDDPCEPPLDEGIEGMDGIELFDDEPPPDEPEDPDEEDWLPELPDGIDGMLEPLLPPLEPELEEELLLEDEEPPELGIDVGMLEEDCWPAHPPMRKADTVPIAVACAAMTSRRSSAGFLFIALSSGIRNAGTGGPTRRHGLF